MMTISLALARLCAGWAKLCRGITAAGRWLVDQIPEAFLLGGAASVTYGVSRLNVPAGWIAGGALALFLGWRLGRATTTPEAPRG